MDSPARKCQASMLILVTLIAWIAAAAKEDDLVSQLPGLPALDFKIYSGYITVDDKNGRALFYFFAEAQNGSQNKPLTLWLSGDPACSSLGLGAFVENGPFHFITETVDPAINPYSWNYESNMLYVEAPAGTGFSYSNTTSDYDYVDDEITALDSFNFLQEWTKKFPEYKDRKLYIAGEGYAGQSVPKLAALLVKAKDTSSLPLQGILMGNPTIQSEVDNELGPLIFFLWSHGEISDGTYAGFQAECERPGKTEPYDPSPACRNILFVVWSEVGYVDLENISGDICADAGISQGRLLPRLKLRTPAALSGSRVKSQSPDPCDFMKMIPYFNRKDVQAALHARLFDGSEAWHPCRDSSEWHTFTPVYREQGAQCKTLRRQTSQILWASPAFDCPRKRTRLNSDEYLMMVLTHAKNMIDQGHSFCTSSYTAHGLGWSSELYAGEYPPNLTNLSDTLYVCGTLGCSIDLGYKTSYGKMQPVLKYLVENSVRVWIYSGDQDATVTFTATRILVSALARELGWTGLGYHNWFADNRVGGWSVRYSQNLLYATVRDAGRMVSRDQPERGLRLFSSFLEGTDLA